MVARSWTRPLAFALFIAARGIASGDAPDGSTHQKIETLLHDSLLDELTGDFAEAVDTLEILEEVSEDPSVNQRVARLLDRGRRSLAFVDRLPELLSTKSAKMHPELQLRDATLCKYVGADSKQICVEIEGEQEMHSAREFTPASLLLLSAHVNLSRDDALARAFIALSEKDDKAFYAGLERASDDLKLKSAIDSALAYRRDLASVPPGGFVRIGGEWKAGSELALKKEIGDTGKLLLLMRSTKAADAEAARARLEELMCANPEGVKSFALAQRDELRAVFEKAPEQKALAALHERVKQLKKAREVALKLIFDEKRYFYPYRPPECPPDRAGEYAAVQAEVDTLVASVRAIWGDENGPPPEPSIRGATFLGIVTELKTLRGVLVDLGVTHDAVDEALAPCWLVPAHCDAITVRNLADDLYDVSRITHDEPILALNRSVQPLKGGVTADELRQVAITNDYRAMMGRRALAWNVKLLNCARGHSEWMERTGTFSHFEESGTPREDPSGRAKLAGYPGAASENILFGDSDPMKAHVGWIHSSGHHRNILLMDHTEMGSGRSRVYWTQNYGGGTEYKGNMAGVKH